MKNKGYTIMEAVIAMFLVVVMVGAVFSALMSSRRAMIASSEREEVLYAIDSAYAAIKDCRSNTNCSLRSCIGVFSFTGPQSIIGCNQFFTFNFDNVCSGTTRAFTYEITDTTSANNPSAFLSTTPGEAPTSVPLQNFEILDIQANCQEAL